MSFEIGANANSANKSFLSFYEIFKDFYLQDYTHKFRTRYLIRE